MTSLVLYHQLFVGDSKMGSLETRKYLHFNDQYYLVPLSKKQCSPAQLAAYLAQQPVDLVNVTTQNKKGHTLLRAQAFEVNEVVEDDLYGICWEERRIIAYSPAYAKRQQHIFEKRLSKAQAALEVLVCSKKGQKKLKTLEEVKAAINKVLAKNRVSEFIQVHIEQTTSTTTLRKYRDRPEQVIETKQFNLDIQVDELKKEQQIKLLGWRAYACNAPLERLNTTQIIECYRNEYKIEHKFDELLNKITALMPVYLHKEHRIVALIRLLLVALKFVSLIQYQARNKLKATKQTLKKVYPGNPGRATDQPTTNMMLNAFKNITLVITLLGGQTYTQVTGLKPLNFQILDLLDISAEAYLGLNKLNKSAFSYFDFHET